VIGILSYKNNFLEKKYLEDLTKFKKKILLIRENKELKTNYSKNWKLQTGGFFEKKKYLIKDNIAFIHVSNHNSNKMLEIIKQFKINTLINSGTTQKISKKIIRSLRYGVINVHPGLLPYYRGSQCVERAILNDDPIFLTAHYMTEKFDEGKVILFKKVITKGLYRYKDIRIKVYNTQSQVLSYIFNNFNKIKTKKNIDFIKLKTKPKIYNKMSFYLLDKVIKKIKNKKYKYQ
jgi:methionyl-tRNA formyltransferase